jgi:hypothetical protein
VAWCSSSVSPQKPLMKSDEMPTCGTTALMCRTSCEYAVRVYPRRMRASVSLWPLCAGMCTCSTVLMHSYTPAREPRALRSVRAIVVSRADFLPGDVLATLRKLIPCWKNVGHGQE